jgi:hypothetical protein
MYSFIFVILSIHIVSPLVHLHSPTGYGPCKYYRMTTNSNNIKLISATNYYTWHDNIVDHLRGQNLWHITTGKEKAPAKAIPTRKNNNPTEAMIFEERRCTASYLQWINAALSMINLSLNHPLWSLTWDCMMPSTVYKAILAHFDKPNVNHDLCDFTELMTIWMGETKTILGYINWINVLIKHMTNDKYKFKPTWAIYFMLCGLPLLYSSIATIIHTQATVTLDFTQLALLQHKSSIVNGTTLLESSQDLLLFTVAKQNSPGMGSTPPSKVSNNGPSKKKNRPHNDHPHNGSKSRSGANSGGGPKPE